MTEAAMFQCAAMAVENFSRRLIDNPRFEEDPVCVTATMAEKYAAELRAQQPETKTQKIATRILAEHITGNGRKKNGRRR